jgi:stearoyl-CoA desaturase (delta-9 desaturase)
MITSFYLRFQREYKLQNILFFLFTFVLSVYGFYLFNNGTLTVGARELTVFFLYYFLIAFSITTGYHRYFSHRSFDAPVVLECIYLLFGSAAFMNSALKWAVDHRLHHLHTDQEHRDPYSIKRGFMYAHIGWALKSDEVDPQRISSKDLKNHKLLNYQHKYIIPLSILTGIIFPLLLGFVIKNVLFGFFGLFVFRVFLFHHSVFLINSFCHSFGSRPKANISATNSVFVAFLTLGDGYHNNHHAFPTDFRAGRRWYDWDPNKWILTALSFFGVISNLRVERE